MPRSEVTAIFQQIKSIGMYFLAHIDFISRQNRNVSVHAERRHVFPCVHPFVTVSDCKPSLGVERLTTIWKLAIKIDPKLFVECMGSYRR